VKNRVHNKKSVSGIGLVIILILVAFIFQLEANAQIKIPTAAKIGKAIKSKALANDTVKKVTKIIIPPSAVKLKGNLNFKKQPQGLLKKIIQPIRFKDNRENNERKRMYVFMMELIHKGQLKIDSSTVDKIMIQLDTITSANKTNNQSIESTNNSIDSLIVSNNLYDKASEAVVDSIKTQMSAVIQESADNNNQEKRDLGSELNKLLKDIRNVQFSCTSNFAEIKNKIEKDSINYFKTCLNPKIKIIGWYDGSMNDKFKNYNYYYLSSINLNGYELSANGKIKNPKDIQKFEKPEGIIELARSKGCDVHLTIHSDNPDDITQFLKDAVARKTLFRELDQLIKKDKLKGINIYFDYIEEPQRFVQFIKELRRNLSVIDSSIQLNITLPGIKDEVSLDEIAAYNFPELNSHVDYYLVLTDNISDPYLNIARASSPLFSSDKYGDRNIESTISFYSNGKIPISKLIMTVSYTGTEWQVEDFSGSLKTDEGKTITYANILEKISRRTDNKLNVIEGFDPDQVASFVNIVGPDPDTKKQIWYEDFRSLYLKYNWALENGLGGVSIRGLGNDDGYPELWDVLGSSLIKIDTTWTDKKPLKVLSLKLKFGDYLNVFASDVKWAVAIRLKYYDSNGALIRFSRVHLKDSIQIFKGRATIWEEWQPYLPKKETENQCYLKNSTYCYALFTRWTIYSELLLWGWGISLCIFLILYIISLYFDRYKLGSDKVQNTVKIVQFLFSFLTIIAFCFWIYLNPRSSIIGAGSDGSNIEILFIFLFLGSIIGWIINSIYNKNKLITKGLP
jgi:spore germination protein YaaH